MEPVASEELLKEKDLRAIFIAARKLPVSYFNQGCTMVTIILLSAYIFLTPEDASAVAEKTRELADYGFSFATSILSFLIAGFTIYLSIAKTDLLLFLSEQRNEQSNLPWIKHAAFAFLRVIIIYVVFCMLCISIKLFGGQNGAADLLLDAILVDPAASKRWIGSICFVVVGAGLVHILLLLQSFIFNVYHTAMLSICWERERAAREAEERGSVESLRATRTESMR
jgi:hypothetical protein